MKIAIDISQIAYQGTGVANYTASLVENLLNIDKENEYVLLGMSFRKRNVLRQYFDNFAGSGGNIRLKTLPIPQTVGNLLWNSLHICNIESILGKIDIFHSSDWLFPPTKAKKITTVHDLVIYKYPELSDPYIITTQKKRLSWVKKECDLIIADSFATKKDIVEILGINPDRIEVVYPGVDDRFNPRSVGETQRVKRKYEISGDYILSVGTSEPRKNIKRVLEAYLRFLKEFGEPGRDKPPLLILAGKAGWGEQLHNLPSTVKSIGLVDKNDLPALYSGASMFVYPSLYEGFGLPVLEAMASNVPVIASNRGSLSEVSGDAAIIVDPENTQEISDNIFTLYQNKTRREKLKELGLRQAKKFNWKNTAGKTLELYLRLIHENN